jgi:hypothetical protein
VSRWVAAPAALLLLALMGWWTYASATGVVGYRGIRSMDDGASVVLSLLRVESIEGRDSYTLSSDATVIEVVGPTVGLVVGEDVTVGGTVSGGVVIEAWRAPAPARGSKRLLGVAGLVAMVALLPLAVRREPDGLALRG